MAEFDLSGTCGGRVEALEVCRPKTRARHFSSSGRVELGLENLETHTVLAPVNAYLAQILKSRDGLCFFRSRGVHMNTNNRQ